MQNPAFNQPFVDPVRLSVTLPTLEYWYAFSVCAVEAERGESVIVMASSAYYARELLKRVVNDYVGVTLVPLGGDWFSPAYDRASLLGIEIQIPQGRIIGSPEYPARTIIWAEPMRQDSLQILDAVARLLKPDGRLCVIAPGSLVRFLPQDQTVHQTLAGGGRSNSCEKTVSRSKNVTAFTARAASSGLTPIG